MFGLGIFTYLKIGAIAIVVAVAGYFVWNYEHMQTKIAGLEQKVQSLETETSILKEAQAATQKYLKEQTAIQRRVANERTQIIEKVDTATDTELESMYDRYRLHPKATGDSSLGRPSRPRHLPAGTP